MKDLKNTLKQWEELIQIYERDSKKIQKKLTTILKSEWGGNARTISVKEMKQFIVRSGKFEKRIITLIKY